MKVNNPLYAKWKSPPTLMYVLTDYSRCCSLTNPFSTRRRLDFSDMPTSELQICISHS